MTLTIGSRGSQLALWQANYIAARLQSIGVETRITIIKTTGDRMQTEALRQMPDKGLFTKEIEAALLKGDIDVAVHSLKDLPTDATQDLTIAAIPEREDPHDVLAGKHLDLLEPGARVGTSSSRRRAQLLMLRPDLQIEEVRGNVDTRLRKLREGQFAAIVLAAAGLRRLGLEHEIAYTFSEQQICPAPGQGALAVQTRLGDDAATICGKLDHLQTRAAVECERTLLAELGGGCQVPIGAYAVADDSGLRLTAGVFAPDGSHAVRLHGEGREPRELGRRIAAQLVREGAHSLLK